MKKYGFLPPYIEKEEYVLGSVGELPSEVLVSDGQWLDFFEKNEEQEKNGVESADCTGFGSIRLVTTYLKKKYGIDSNYSERALGIMAGTKPPGNTPHKVLETIRTEGLAEDSLLPFDDSVQSVEQFYSPDPLPISITENAQKFLDLFDFKHAWLFYPTAELAFKQKQLKTALKSSPVGVSVMAWRQEGEFYTKEIGETDNHWTCLTGYKDGEYWLVKDSYSPFLKKLKWDFNFGFAKRIYIEKKNQELTIAPTKPSLWQIILNFFTTLFAKKG